MPTEMPVLQRYVSRYKKRRRERQRGESVKREEISLEMNERKREKKRVLNGFCIIIFSLLPKLLAHS